MKIGGNSWVKPGVRINDGAVIGGGSVVTRDVPEHEVWCGTPPLADVFPAFAGISADAVADAIVYAISRPADVAVSEVLIRPTVSVL